MIQYSILENGEIKETFNSIEELINHSQKNTPIYKEVIEYLNQKCMTKFKHTTKATQRYINARLKEGYTLEDFKKVIDIKEREWSNTSMNIYLRPETLFSPKFESYINQREVKSNGKFKPNEFSKYITEAKPRELTEEERIKAGELL